jgi:hypothetical protein
VSDDAFEVRAKALEIDLIAKPEAEGRSRPFGVIARAVEPPIDDRLDPPAQRLKDRGDIQPMPLLWRILRRQHGLDRFAQSTSRRVTRFGSVHHSRRRRNIDDQETSRSYRRALPNPLFGVDESDLAAGARRAAGGGGGKLGET